VKELTEGEQNRYEYWLSKVECLALKHHVSPKQVVAILENFQDWKNMFNIVEIDKFIHVFFIKDKNS
jgi:hypothetical protein